MTADIPEQEPISAEKKKDKSEQQKEEAPLIAPVAHAELNIPSDVTDQYNADQTKNYKLERWKFRVEVLTLIAIAVYTVIAYHQWAQMREATKAAKQSADAAQKAADTADATLKSSQASFQIDQRPYIVSDIPQFLAPPKADGNPVKANVTFKNIGRTPAIKETTYIINLLPYHPTKSTARLVDFLESSFADLKKKEDSGGGKYAPLARKDVAPSSTFFSTAETKAPLSVQEITELEKGDFALFYVGRVTYVDAFDKRYETEFCYLYFGSDPKTWHICDSHNIIK